MSQPLNPYAPPAAPRLPAFTVHGRRPRGLILKWIYVATVGVPVSADLFAAAVADDSLRDIADVAGLLFVVTYAVALGWIYAVWADIPRAARGNTTPAGAVLGFFLPGFNLYWLFAMNKKLCSLLNRRLIEVESPVRAPEGLAIVGAIGHLAGGLLRVAQIPLLDALVLGATGMVWFLYMKQCDLARVTLASAESERPTLSS